MKKQLLVIRFLTFGKYDFVNEHQNLLKEQGAVWVLKTGKNIPDKALEEIAANGGQVIFKAPKATGGKYYYGHFVEYRQGLPEKNMAYPDYYHLLPDGYDRAALDGTWLKIDSLLALEESKVEKLLLSSNGKKVSEVIGQTRTSVMYAYFQE